MATNMETSKSIYDDDHSNWAPTKKISSSLRSYAKEMVSIEQPTAIPSKQLLDNFIGCQLNTKCSNSNPMERLQIRSGQTILGRSTQLPSHLKATTATSTAKNQRQFTCTLCPFSCSWFYDLKIHIRQRHKITDATHILLDKRRQF